LLQSADNKIGEVRHEEKRGEFLWECGTNLIPRFHFNSSV